MAPFDALPTSFIYSNVSLRWNNERVKSWGTFFNSQHFEGRGACWSSGMGTRKSDKHQLLTQTCTNQTISWLIHSLSIFGVKMNLNLGREATTFPLIVYFMPLHEAHIQMTFCLETPKWESQNSQSWDSRDFGDP
jgi:hypothetical protein